MQHSLLLQFFSFFCLIDVSKLWRISAYIHIADGVKIVHELSSLSNNTASVMFLHQLGVVGSDDWILITGAPAWRWLGKNLTLNKTVYILYKHWKFLYTIVSPTRSISAQRDCVWSKCITFLGSNEQCGTCTVFTQTGSGGKCWLDTYHLGAGLAMTGQKPDIGQNSLHSL